MTRPGWRSALRFLLAAPLAVLGLATLHARFIAPRLPAPTLAAEPGMGIDELLVAAQAASGAPAVGVALVGASGASAIHVAGTRERGGHVPVGRGDPWHLGSDGKAMVAVVYARLVEQGRARWGASIPELFPDLADGIDPAWRPVTVDDLLAHRAGVSDAMLRFGLLRMQFDARPADLQRTELARGILASPPRGTPGSFAYANLSYVLAGAAVERIAGVPFEAAMARELFRPLGLASAGFGAPRGDAPRGHGRPWLPFLRSGPVDPGGRFSDNPPALSPAGRVHMSLADWGRFAAIFLQGDGDGFLRAQTVGELLSPPAEGEAYAFGWARAPGFGTPVFTHSGSNTLWCAVAVLAPKRGLAVLVVANDGSDASRAIMPALARRLLAEKLPGPASAQPAPTGGSPSSDPPSSDQPA